MNRTATALAKCRLGALHLACRKRGGQNTSSASRSPERREVAGWLLQRGIGGGRNLGVSADWLGDA